MLPGHRQRRRRRRAVAVLAGVLLAVGVGCSAERPEGSPDPSPAPSPTSPATASPSAPDATPEQPPRPLTIAVAGDVHFEGALRGRLADPTTALAPATRALAAADLAVVNLETSLGNGGRPEPGKRYPFQAPVSALAALREAGVDVATMANNHALDFGREPLPGVFSAIREARAADPRLSVVGLGRNVREAFRPSRHVVDGTVVATLGATLADTDPTADRTGHWAATVDSPGTADAMDPTRLLRSARAAARSADVVLVYLHWGVQGEACPTEGQRTLATRLVRAGADIIVGSHAHRLQGDGRVGPGYVAYGLGNYAWYTPSEEATGVLTLTVRPAAAPAGRARVADASWTPARIGASGLPEEVTGPEAPDFQSRLAGLRACAGFDRAGR
ncbi:CapA family protein [Nocardioides ferulae]|uniref:CapA family protein n=1 Tax=Nocardioides ferulae TaxID=2340821 RepID=UPI000EB0750D|nr:CapA family protein [Nocardioides ferulae]